MCLMCLYYYDSCDKYECVERIKSHPNRTARMEEYYSGRSGVELFLWTGITEPCEHILQSHGPECYVVKKQDIKYVHKGIEHEYFGYDSCNCYFDEEWVYNS